MKDTFSLTPPPSPPNEAGGNQNKHNGDTYNCAPFGNPLLRNMFHGNLRVTHTHTNVNTSVIYCG